MNDFLTGRCQLRPAEVGDVDNVSRLYSDQEVRRFLGGPVTPEEVLERFEDLLSDDMGKTWTVRLRSTSSFIGVVGIGKHHNRPEQELSYQFLPEFWNQGYAGEVVSAVIEYAANVIGLSSLIAETQCANHASRRLLEKVGMRPAQTLSRFGADQIIYHCQLPFNSR